MAKFQIGDLVRVLDGSKIDRYTGSWALQMKECVGKDFVIKKIVMDYGDRIAYELETDYPFTHVHWDERGLERVVFSLELEDAISEAIAKAQVAPGSFNINIGKGLIMSRFRFDTTEGVRYTSEGKHKGKTIPTVTTTVYDDVWGRKASATCDKECYDERQGILEAIANLTYGNFDREYDKYKNKQKRIEAALCKCGMCGKTFKSKEEARACEDAHIERKAEKREKYRMRKAAEKRAREMKIEQMAKEIIRKESHEKS